MLEHARQLYAPLPTLNHNPKAMSAVRKQLYYFWKKLSEKNSRTKYATKFFKNDITRFNDCSTKKPAAQIKREMKVLQKYWNCYPFQYYQFDLYRNDCTLSLDEMKKYVPKFFLNHLFFPISYKDYGIACEDKLLTYVMLKAYDIPQPGFLFCYDHNSFYDAQNNPISGTHVDHIISASTAEKLFIKARFGSEGKGIFVFTRSGSNQFVDEKGASLNHGFFESNIKAKTAAGRDSTGFYIVQEGLVQHHALNRIYPHSVNTFRIITEYENGKAQILYSLLRMGCGGNQVDNAAVGGLYIKVDAETGELADFAYTATHSKHMVHPDTKFQFKGARIEQWDAIKTFALMATLKFREIKYIGWDIAITTAGFLIIEINHQTGFDIVQDYYGGARDVLKINPKDWWYKSNYTVKNH